MRKKPYESHTLDDPQQALRVYLDALLAEVAFPDAVLETEVPAAEPAVVTAAASDQKEAAVVAPAVPAERVSADSAAEETLSAAGGILQPEWAAERFQCLSFQVAGVTLAAPLEKMNGIVELTETLTELPGYAPWVLGLLPNRGQNVQVVDIAQIIMPEERQHHIAAVAERIKYVILVDGGRFGLAADGLSQVLTLDPAEVRWRSLNSKRPWLAGTVVEQMCALLEIDRLCEQLAVGLDGIGSVSAGEGDEAAQSE